MIYFHKPIYGGKSVKKLTMVILIIAVIVGMSACTPSATIGAGAPSQAVTAGPTPSPSDQPTPEPTAPPTEEPATEPTPWQTVAAPGDFDMRSESVGPVRLGMTESELLAVLGQPDEESEAQEWGSDGMKHSDWAYKALGLSVNMSDSANPESEFTVFSVSATAPCTEATQRGIKIGDKKDAVTVTYADAINPEDSSENEVVVGSIFGGLIFYIENGAVSSIFIGAAAE
jgi:hypothetical protein